MTKLLIGVKSCQRDKDLGFHDLIRATWGKDAKALGVDVRFFVGASMNKYESDEVHLKCADDYNSLAFKTREICRWAGGKVLDYIFLADTDTFLIPKLMLKSGFENYDYAGKISRPFGVPFKYEHTGREGQKEIHQRAFPWASGGFGYFLSKRALSEVAYGFPSSECEDLWVGQVMGALYTEAKIKMESFPTKENPVQYSFHHPQHGEVYDNKTMADWMNQMYRDNQ